MSAAFGALTLPLLYVLVRRVGPPRAAVVAVALLAAAPVFVYNAVTATTYTAEAFFSVALALAAWDRLQRPSLHSGLLLSALFALAVGVRTSLGLFLLPLVGYALARPHLTAYRGADPDGKRRAVAAALREGGLAAAAFAAIVLAWAVPMVTESGGWASYRAAAAYQTREVVFAELVGVHGVAPLWDHLRRLTWFLRHEIVYLPLWMGGLALVAWVTRRTGRARDAAAPASAPLGRDGPRAWSFLAWWVLPALLFQVLVFNGWDRGPVGYALVFLPALYALVGLAADRFAAQAERAALPLAHRARHVGQTLMLAFLLAPLPFLLAAADADVDAEVRAHDAWTASWADLPTSFPPNETLLLASHSWAHAKWYHPEYRLYAPFIVPDDGPLGVRRFVLLTHERSDEVPFYRPHVDPAPLPLHPIPAGTARVVLHDFQLAGENDGVRQLREDIEVQEAFLASGWRVLYFVPDANATIEDHLRPLADIVREGGP